MNKKSPYKKGGMFEGASHLVFELAKNLRKNMTDAEINLWMHLKAGVKGLKFRRQHPIGIYIADFYCHKVKLIVEADGKIHQRKDIKEYDEQRENSLLSMGYTIIRFTNDEILKNIEIVLAAIEQKVDALQQRQIN